ncbi:MAG: biopolymer transporter [Myxococcales bacterium 68-20]|nr:biopolymer transporter ExbD [Myxococcales bacterium]OJY29252.1 MAG: biopolymer transporter [Myxococcales bacterium 68-20]
MGGVDVGGGGGGKREMNSEINMIPMIDLLMVLISFLLITAVWTHMGRLNADAQVPGPPREVEPDKVEVEKQLHVEMRSPDKFVLIWKQGGTVISTVDVPRKDNVIEKEGKKMIRFPELAAKIEQEWKTAGSHRDPSDKKFDQAILHTDNETPYVYLIGVIDAIYKAHRPFNVGGKAEQVPAFNVTFAVN